VVDGPLSGRRIVVTRPEATPLVAALEDLGAEVTLVPLIEIRQADVEDSRALDAALEVIGDYDWLVFTSVNGVAPSESAFAASASVLASRRWGR
jgi:uroporphyrinogen III methyltransferase/synthase